MGRRVIIGVVLPVCLMDGYGSAVRQLEIPKIFQELRAQAQPRLILKP